MEKLIDNIKIDILGKYIFMISAFYLLFVYIMNLTIFETSYCLTR